MVASFIYTQMEDAVDKKTTAVIVRYEAVPDYFNYQMELPWNSYKLAATLVLLCSSPRNGMFQAIQFMSHRLCCLLTASLMRRAPSASFGKAFAAAKELALSHQESTTVIGVSLVDVHIFELADRGMPELY